MLNHWLYCLSGDTILLYYWILYIPCLPGAAEWLYHWLPREAGDTEPLNYWKY